MDNSDRNVLIIQRLNKSFNQYPDTKDNKDLFAELFGNLRDSASEKMAAGKTAQEAVDAAFQEFGDIDALLQEVNAEDGTAPKPAAARQSAEEKADEDDDDKIEINLNDLSSLKNLGKLGKIGNNVAKRVTKEVNESLNKPGATIITNGHTVVRNGKWVGSHDGDERLQLVNSFEQSSDGIHKLTVDYPDDLELQPTDDANFHFAEYMTTDDPAMYATADQAGDTLRIRAGKRSHFGISILINSRSWGFRARAVLQVPKTYTGAITVNGDDGNVAVHDLGALTDVALRVSDGNLQVAKITGDNLSAKSDDGNLGLSDIHFTNTDVSSDDGNAHLANVTAKNLQFRMDDGNLSLQDVRSETLTVQGDDGNFSWREVQATQVDMQYEDGNFSGQELTFGDLRISTEDGRGNLKQISVANPVSIATDDGNFTLTDFHGSGDFTTEDGTLSLDFAEVTGDVSVEGDDGNIRLAFPANAAYAFDLHRDDGSLRLPAEAEYSKQGKHRAIGNVGSGAPEFSVSGSVVDGRITIR